jgi:Ni,Fe-hydrogenase I large subunit
MSRLLVGPFNRVEGDLEVVLDVHEGRVASAHVNATMYRGFEQILQGKAPHDALVYVPRICGICSVSQSVASARALADLGGLVMPPNGQHATNLMLATENLADHLTHFYLFFMPDFVRPVYAGRPWHAEACAGSTPRRASRCAKPPPHASAGSRCWAPWAANGLTRRRWSPVDPPAPSTRPSACACWPRCASSAAFWSASCLLPRWKPWPRSTARPRCGTGMRRLQLGGAGGVGGDFRFFLSLVRDLGLESLGPGPGRYLSYGAYPQPGGGWALPGGVWRAGTASTEPLVLRTITEDATHAWLAHAREPLHPLHGLTRPEPDKPGAYTWNKAPRLGGEVVETGAIARQLTSGTPLVT